MIPEPQSVSLTGADFEFTPEWRLELGPGVSSGDVAVESLRENLKFRFGLELSTQGRSSSHTKKLRLVISPKSVEIGEAADRNKQVLAEQAYEITLAPEVVTIRANALAGLFYGVETFIQLLKPQGTALWLPAGRIVDWPDLELRQIFWDDARHLDHMDELKRAIRQAAFYKVNGFALKLNGHFQYKSAASIVEPYALTPAELQELTDYALRYHTHLIPYLDGPAHVAFILKHPEYEKLREFPESNYEMCVTNPDTYKLYLGMFQELLDANRGGKYFLLSTDEPYYVGLAKNAQCNEVDRAHELGSVGKLLAEFISKTAGYLHDHGRQVIFWGEYPLKPDDVSALPSYLVNGEVYGPDFDPLFKAHGIRQTVYVSTEGSEQLFPNYYLLPSLVRGPHPRRQRVAGMFDHISNTPARQQADLMGVFIAAWSDEGLHPETFWLGFVTGTAAGWHPGSPDIQESMNTFYRVFYGPGAKNMGRAYQLMSTQAEFWEQSWDWGPSSARKPIFGNSDAIWRPPRPARDQSIPVPPVPSPDLLRLDRDWRQENSERLRHATDFLPEDDELLDLLHKNLQHVSFNRYNLEVFLSLAQLYRQNLEMLIDLARISDELKSAEAAAAKPDVASTVAAVDRALDIAEYIRQQRNTALHDLVETWYKTWFPRVEEANGRRFLHVLNDVQDYHASRTVDLSYLIFRELIYPLGEWADEVRSVRNQYALAHNLPARNDKLDWKDTQTLRSLERVPDEE